MSASVSPPNPRSRQSSTPSSGRSKSTAYSGNSGGHTVLAAATSYAIINLFHLTIGEQAPTYLAIDRIQAKDIMVAREDIVAVSADASAAENFAAIAGTPHVRFPLVNRTLDDVQGVVYVPTLLDRKDDLEARACTFADIAVSPMTVSPDIAVSELIDEFQAENRELAVVVEDGRTVGVVTATDAFEVVMGELEDPLDAAD